MNPALLQLEASERKINRGCTRLKGKRGATMAWHFEGLEVLEQALEQKAEDQVSPK